MRIGTKLGQEMSEDKGSDRGVLIFVIQEDMGNQQIGLLLLKFQNILGCIQLLKPCKLKYTCLLLYNFYKFYI